MQAPKREADRWPGSEGSITQPTMFILFCRTPVAHRPLCRREQRGHRKRLHFGTTLYTIRLTRSRTPCRFCGPTFVPATGIRADRPREALAGSATCGCRANWPPPPVAQASGFDGDCIIVSEYLRESLRYPAGDNKGKHDSISISLDAWRTLPLRLAHAEQQ